MGDPMDLATIGADEIPDTSSVAKTADRVLILKASGAIEAAKPEEISESGDPFDVTDINLANDLTIAAAGNIITNATTGTQFATAVTQKVGFWGVTPIVQPAAAAQADQGALTGAANASITGAAVGDLVATNNGWGASSEANFDKIATAVDANVVDIALILAQADKSTVDILAIDVLLTAIRTALVNAGIMKGAS